MKPSESIEKLMERFGALKKKLSGNLSASFSPIGDQHDKEVEKIAYSLKERVKELDCMFAISRLIENPDLSKREKLMQELVIAKEKAEVGERLKSAFLANMGHEIRTPMNGILGFTGLLKNPDLASEQKDQYIDIIHSSGQRMLNTVNDIVEFSMIEAGSVHLENDKTDVHRKIEDHILFFSHEAEKKGLSLVFDNGYSGDGCVILTDQSKLDSILTNLIKNAIKYTKAGEIHVGYREEDGSYEFYVKDTGVGIPKELQEAVFSRFEQADNSETRPYEGSGLGLTIANSYVEMLGGKMWLESEVDRGSTFYFSLPCTLT